MFRIIKIIITQFKQLSFHEFGSLVLRNIFQSDPLLVYAIHLPGLITMPAPDILEYKIAKGTFTDLEHARNQLKPVPWEFQCDLFDNVCDYFVAKDSTGVKCICWIYYSSDHNRILKLGPNDAEIKFCLTLPEARGQGLYPVVINAIKAYLSEKGLLRVYMCVHKENKPSIRGIEKAGFVCVGSLKLRKVLGVQISKRYVAAEG